MASNADEDKPAFVPARTDVVLNDDDSGSNMVSPEFIPIIATVTDQITVVSKKYPVGTLLVLCFLYTYIYIVLPTTA